MLLAISGDSDHDEDIETWEDLLEMEENAWDPNTARGKPMIAIMYTFDGTFLDAETHQVLHVA